MIEAVKEPKRGVKVGRTGKERILTDFRGEPGRVSGEPGNFFERERQRARQKNLIIKPVK